MNGKDKPKKSEESAPDAGVFITKGMQINIPRFSIRIGPDGKLQSDPLVLHTSIDLCPYWLDIAYEQLLAAEKASEDLKTAKEAQNSEQIATALHVEFTAGMQVIMASAVAMDAYYANVKDRIDFPNDLTRTWLEKGTARYKQIAEVLRRAFPMTHATAKKLRDILKQNLEFRNKAVHPPVGTTAPALHPELNKVTDWRYVTFRYYNAKATAGLTLSIIAQTASRPPKDKFSALTSYCNSLMAKVEPMVKRWEIRFGKLFGEKGHLETRPTAT